jgi:hypothetical protein
MRWNGMQCNAMPVVDYCTIVLYVARLYTVEPEVQESAIRATTATSSKACSAGGRDIYTRSKKREGATAPGCRIIGGAVSHVTSDRSAGRYVGEVLLPAGVAYVITVLRFVRIWVGGKVWVLGPSIRSDQIIRHLLSGAGLGLGGGGVLAADVAETYLSGTCRKRIFLTSSVCTEVNPQEDPI